MRKYSLPLKKFHSSPVTPCEMGNETRADPNETARGVVYIARVPPAMTPAEMKRLLGRFAPVDRIYLAPSAGSTRTKARFTEAGSSSGQAAGATHRRSAQRTADGRPQRRAQDVTARICGACAFFPASSGSTSASAAHTSALCAISVCTGRLHRRSARTPSTSARWSAESRPARQLPRRQPPEAASSS